MQPPIKIHVKFLQDPTSLSCSRLPVPPCASPPPSLRTNVPTAGICWCFCWCWLIGLCWVRSGQSGAGPGQTGSGRSRLPPPHADPPPCVSHPLPLRKLSGRKGVLVLKFSRKLKGESIESCFSKYYEDEKWIINVTYSWGHIIPTLVEALTKQ